MEPHVGFACATRKLDYCVALFRARLQSQTVKTHSSFALVCFSPIALSDILIWVDLMLWKKKYHRLSNIFLAQQQFIEFFIMFRMDDLWISSAFCFRRFVGRDTKIYTFRKIFWSLWKVLRPQKKTIKYLMRFSMSQSRNPVDLTNQ